MQPITLHIDNPQVENILFSLSKQLNKSVEQVAIDLLKRVSISIGADKSVDLNYKTFDASKLMTKISYNDISETPIPFVDIDDSGLFIKNMRQTEWNR